MPMLPGPRRPKPPVKPKPKPPTKSGYEKLPTGNIGKPLSKAELLSYYQRMQKRMATQKKKGGMPPVSRKKPSANMFKKQF